MFNDFKELLIIDDDCCHNIVCALAIKKLFRTSDVNFTCFTNSEEGLAYIMQSTASNKKTILFLDINMPRLDGWQVLERLEQLPRSVKRHLDVYILTASPNAIDKQRALRSSLVKQYLEKPLFQHLQSVFAKRTLQLTAA
jgi:CheY-like chemotaxis protein